jgi:hypothetical protein
VLRLAQNATPATRARHPHLGLPLEVREVGDEVLEGRLAALLSP